MKKLGLILLVALASCASTKKCCAQVKVIHFNAEWNDANKVKWFAKLSDAKKEHMDIGKGDCQAKYKIAIVPTILVLKDGEEVARFQADLSFKMLATRKEIQAEIDNQLMSDF
ncbi:MAG: hypothetical protein CMI60_07600 [Parvibaculum sp.]|nr:hypothetical protein [Parvibaculum sp.]